MATAAVDARAAMVQGDFKKVADVARQTGYSRAFVYQLVDSGELAAVRVGRTVRIPQTALTKFLSDNLQG